MASTNITANIKLNDIDIAIEKLSQLKSLLTEVNNIIETINKINIEFKI